MVNKKDPYAVIVPSEGALQAPIAPAIELTKLFIAANETVNLLASCRRIIPSTDDNGVEHITVVDHPDLKWWFHEAGVIANNISKITVAVEAKDVEHKLQAMDIVLKSSSFPAELREQLVRYAYAQKGIKVEHPND
jgi:hypothetical protein